MIKDNILYLKNAQTSIKVVWFSTIFYIIWLFLPQVQNLLGAKAGIACMALFFVAVLLDKSFIKNNFKQLTIKTVSLFLIVAYYAAIYMDNLNNSILYFLQTILFFYPVLIAFYVKKKKDKRIIIGTFTLIVLLSLLTASVNIFWLRNYPNTARSLGHGASDPEYLKRAMSYGIGGFGFVYGMPILFTFILFYISKLEKVYLKILAIITLIVLAVSVILSRYFIAIMLIMLALILYVVYTIVGIICKKNQKANKFFYTIIIMLILLIILFVFKETLFNLIIDVFYDLNLDDYALKVQTIKDLIVDLKWNSRSTSRINQYVNGIKTICWSPLTGSINSNFAISRHSDIIDMFAGWGVVCGIAMLWLLYFLFKDTYSDVLSSKYNYIYKFTLLLFLTLAFANTINYSREAAIVIFLLPLYIDPNLNYKGVINE